MRRDANATIAFWLKLNAIGARKHVTERGWIGGRRQTELISYVNCRLWTLIYDINYSY